MRLLAAALLAAAMIGTGCGSGGGGDAGVAAPPATTPTQRAPGADQLVRGTGYALELPNSWVDEAEAVKGSAVKADLAYADPSGRLPHKNIVVVRETPKGITEANLGQVDKVFRGQATALATPAGVSPTQDRTLAGAKAKTYTYVLRQAGGVMRQRQVFTIHDGAVYTISWTAPARSFSSTIPLLEKVLASWRWT